LGLGIEISCEICSLRLFYMEKVLGQILDEVWEEVCSAEAFTTIA
jgi:hypothetical protein